MQFSIPARQPFNFLSVVNSHGWVQLAPFVFDQEGATLSYVMRLASGRVTEIGMSATDGGVGVQVKGRLTRLERDELARAVSWMFGLDMDFSAFYKAARGEPKLRRAAKLARGRVLRSPTLFEDVVKTILTTNTLWGATKRMTLNLLGSFGDPIPGGEARAFPTPERIALAGPKRLREKVRLGYRAPYVHELAVRVASGDLELESLKTSPLPTPELRKELMSISGVGPYAAANLLLILGRSDFIPIDTWALKLVSHEWYEGGAVGPREVEAAFEKWGEFKGLAFWFWDWKYTG